jgi:hypothetical protein
MPAEAWRRQRPPAEAWRRQDIEITRRLCEVGEIMGVRVLDHIIIGKGRYVSLLGSGLRVSELLGLKREQYTGRGFQNVLVKGGRIREFGRLHGWMMSSTLTIAARPTPTLLKSSSATLS